MTDEEKFAEDVVKVSTPEQGNGSHHTTAGTARFIRGPQITILSCQPGFPNFHPLNEHETLIALFKVYLEELNDV